MPISVERGKNGVRTMTNEPTASADRALLAWIEPEMHELDVKDSANNPHVGGDAGGFADCSLS